MNKIRCPYCGSSDGDDDIEITTKYFASGSGYRLESETVMMCDICNKKYVIRRVYTREYEVSEPM